MSYYRGDYYRGDFFRNVGRAFKKGIKDIGRVVRDVAPLAGILVPAIGAATLVGKGISAANKIKQTGRNIRAAANDAVALQSAPGGMTLAPTLATRAPMPVLVSGMMPATTQLPLPLPSPVMPGVTAMTRKAARARAGYRKRKAAPKRKPQPRRRRRRNRSR